MTSAWEVAARLAASSPHLALVVVHTADATEVVAREVRETLADLRGEEVDLERVSTARALEELTGRPGSAVALGLDQFDDQEWRAMDRARTRLSGRGLIVLVGDGTVASALATSAPNLASWLAGTTYVMSGRDEPEPADVNRQLDGLRARFEMTDDQAISAAESQVPPSEQPEFAVWMVLLGRPDLVRRSTR